VTLGGPCRVLLVGMMGSGKSTIGRLLADATGWPYADNDELVARAHGTTPRGLLAKRGEAAMRRAESEALESGVALPPPAIVGVAAGVILDAADRDALRGGGVVIWLRASADELAARAAGAEHRPWLDADPIAWMTAALLEREPLYASVADHVVETDAAAPGETVARLTEWLLAETACASAPRVRSAGPS
jgi:shikimate kinase